MADVLSRRPEDFVGNEMGKLMRSFFGRPMLAVSGEGFWHPPVDIHIPGINPDEIEISIEENRLIVRGTRIACQEAAKDEHCWYNETKRGDFHRVIDLPEYVDSEKTDAT